MQVVFFGSSSYCLPVLESLKINFNLAAVVTKPDRPVGRKQVLFPSAVKEFALNNKTAYFTPPDKSGLAAIKQNLLERKPDFFVVADYGMIIPADIFNLPKYRTVNIHFSKLPDLRGASPVQYTILRGDASAWISYMLMAEKMDTGDILGQTEYPLLGNETTGELYPKLFERAASQLPEILEDYVHGNIRPVPQDKNKVTYTKILTRDDGFLPRGIFQAAVDGTRASQTILNTWPLYQNSPIIQKQSANSNFQLSILIERMLRAFTPWPGVWTEAEFRKQNSESSQKKRLKILTAHLEESGIRNQESWGKEKSTTSNQHSTISSKSLNTENQALTTYQQLPTTKLVPDLVQLEGKNPVSWNQFRMSYQIFCDSRHQTSPEH